MKLDVKFFLLCALLAIQSCSAVTMKSSGDRVYRKNVAIKLAESTKFGKVDFAHSNLSDYNFSPNELKKLGEIKFSKSSTKDQLIDKFMALLTSAFREDRSKIRGSSDIHAADNASD